MADIQNDSAPDPQKVLKFISDWKEVFTAASSMIGGGLVYIKVPGDRAALIGGAITLIGLAITGFLYRARVKAQEQRQADEIVRERSETKAGAAFRGLRRYLRGQQLPCKDRRDRANDLLRYVEQRNFKICTVTGESGAGKSSLIECALIGPLETAGRIVIEGNAHVRQSMADGHQSERTSPDEIWDAIRADVAQKKGTSTAPVLLILDQFEELLTRFPDDVERSRFGALIQQSLDEGWGIIISIRKEFYPDLQAVALKLKPQLSWESMFRVHNFTEAQAAEVILECSVRDEIVYDDELPETIARDLMTAGEVRPPDLQIVCEALRGEFTLDRYKKERRAVGLRSKFIKEVTQLAGTPALVRAVLRSLCDIPNNKKQPTPLTTAAITAKVRGSIAADVATEHAVANVLKKLYDAYIVEQTRLGDGTIGWSLIHDYLAEPIKIATEEMATRREAAAAELDYFVDRRIGVIPLDRLNEVVRHAPPAKLEESAVRKLIRISRLMGYGRPLVLGLFVAILSTAVVVGAVADWSMWQAYGKRAGHWDVFGQRPGGLSAAPLGKDMSFIVVTSETIGTAGPDWSDRWSRGLPNRSKRQTVWNVRTGEQIASREGMLISPPVGDGKLWSYDTDLALVTFNPTDGSIRKYPVPVSDSSLHGAMLSVARNSVVVLETEDDSFISLRLTDSTMTLVEARRDIYPPSESRSASTALHGRRTDNARVWMAATRERLRLTVRSLDLRTVVADVLLPMPVPAGGVAENADYFPYLLPMIDDVQGAVVSLWAADETIKLLHLSRNAISGEFDARSVRVDQLMSVEVPASFHRQGGKSWRERRNVWSTYARGDNVVFVDATGLRIWIFNPRVGKFKDPLFASSSIFVSQNVLVWGDASNGSTYLWPQQSAEPIHISSLKFKSKDRYIINESKDRVLRIPESGAAELWSLVGGKSPPIKPMATIELDMLTNTEFSSDGQLVIARQEGGALWAWSSKDGSKLDEIGNIGSDVIWSTYDESCERILLWTSEGQRLDLRRGANIPFYGFEPRHRACMNASEKATAPSAAPHSAGVM